MISLFYMISAMRLACGLMNNGNGSVQVSVYC